MSARIIVDRDRIADFCRRWKIDNLSFFGSILRDDFDSDSDVDVLVSFAPDAQWGLFDMARMREELRGILGREVDLVSRRAVEASRNYIRRKAILSSAEVVYGA
jgi:predicted nucleotidyltransferase